MTLGNFINFVYKKYKKDYPKDHWRNFEAEPLIKLLNKYLDYPLYSKDHLRLIKEVDELLQNGNATFLKDVDFRPNFLHLLRKTIHEFSDIEVRELLAQLHFSNHERMHWIFNLFHINK